MMAKLPAKQITSWSWSRYADYKLCPAKAKYKHLDKLKEPTNAAMERGTTIHKLAEDYVKGLLRVMPDELKKFDAQFKQLKTEFKKKTLAMIVEDNWGFNSSWEEVAYNDWDNCWVRIKIDLVSFEGDMVAVVTDHKTGKYNADAVEEYLEQLSLYALSVFKRLPHIKAVRPRLWFLDHGIEYPLATQPPILYKRADLPKLEKAWATKTKAMLADKTFAPRPNDKCRFCHYRKNNGGPCKF